MSQNLLLSVSIGEALDKLTILQIKYENIQDENKKKEVFNEISKILPVLTKYIDSNQYFYKLLYLMNKNIWDEMDILRKLTINDPRFLIETQKSLDDNDARCRIKDKINCYFNSDIKEVKGYAKKILFLYGNAGGGDIITMNAAIRYFSQYYDKVIFHVNPNSQKSTEKMFSSDKNIEPNGLTKLINYDGLESLNQYISKTKPEERLFDVKYFGLYVPNRHFESSIYNKRNFYEVFYEDLGLDYKKIKKRYHHIDRNSENEMSLYNKHILQNNITEYVFIHDDRNQGKNIINIDTPYYKYHPNSNMYNDNENCSKFYDNTKYELTDYIKIIENATEIHMIDSSFFCLCAHLNLDQVKRKVVYLRKQYLYLYVKNNILDINFFKNYGIGEFNWEIKILE